MLRAAVQSRIGGPDDDDHDDGDPDEVGAEDFTADDVDDEPDLPEIEAATVEELPKASSGELPKPAGPDTTTAKPTPPSATSRPAGPTPERRLVKRRRPPSASSGSSSWPSAPWPPRCHRQHPAARPRPPGRRPGGPPAPRGGARRTLDQAIEIIRNRVDALGVAEPEITRQGRIIVALPGVKNSERALEVVGQTAQLLFRPVSRSCRPDHRRVDPATDGPAPRRRRATPTPPRPGGRRRRTGHPPGEGPWGRVTSRYSSGRRR